MQQRLERVRAKAAAEARAAVHAKLHLLKYSKRLDEEREQRSADSDEIAKLRAEVRRLELVAAVAHSRTCASRDAASGANPVAFFPLRAGSGASCAYSARTTHEFARRLVEECGMSFEAAANANALVLAMH
eukprot:5219534-Pleurochrysis_carterae.AAC.1